MKTKIFIFLTFFIAIQAYAQTDTVAAAGKTVPDSVKAHVHSPFKAAIYSLVLPGLGQAYNKKYWKIPVVYAGLGGLGFGFFKNRTDYQTAREAYLSRMDQDPNNDIDYKGYTTSQLQTVKNNYKSAMDIFTILGIVWWSLNIVDASVDAHLYNFDISDKLSLHVQPNIYQTPQAAYCGIGFEFKFK